MKKLLLASILIIHILASVVYANDSINTPYFQISEASRRTLITNAKKIKVGDSYRQVVETLGQPSFDQMLTLKENDQNIGRVLKYYAVVWEKNLVNEIKDQFVRVVFNNSGIVTEIEINVPPF